MRADIVPIEGLAERDLAAWRALGERSLEPNPSFEPEFVLPAARVLDPGAVHLLRVVDDGDWVACLPVRRARRWRRVPLPAALLGWWHLYSLLGTPLVDAARAGPAIEALVDVALEDRETRLTALDFVTADGPTRKAIGDAVAARGAKELAALPTERAILRRREQDDYLAAGRKHRREWQRQRRRLQELLGEELATVDRSEDQSAVADFLDLEAGGWKGRAGTAFASIPGHSEIFTEICAGFRARGRLQLLALEAGSRRVAVKCNLLAGEEIHCFKIAFDDELARFSPGIQLEIDNIHFFHEHTGASLMDSCASERNAMINRLWPDRRPLESLLFTSGGIRGTIGVGAARTATRLRERSSK